MTEKEFEANVEKGAEDLERSITNKWKNKKMRILHHSIAFLGSSSLIIASCLTDVPKDSPLLKTLFDLGVVGIVGTFITIKTTK